MRTLGCWISLALHHNKCLPRWSSRLHYSPGLRQITSPCDLQKWEPLLSTVWHFIRNKAHGRKFHGFYTPQSRHHEPHRQERNCETEETKGPLQFLKSQPYWKPSHTQALFGCFLSCGSTAAPTAKLAANIISRHHKQWTSTAWQGSWLVPNNAKQACRRKSGT